MLTGVAAELALHGGAAISFTPPERPKPGPDQRRATAERRARGPERAQQQRRARAEQRRRRHAVQDRRRRTTAPEAATAARQERDRERIRQRRERERPSPFSAADPLAATDRRDPALLEYVRANEAQTWEAALLATCLSTAAGVDTDLEHHFGPLGDAGKPPAESLAYGPPPKDLVVCATEFRDMYNPAGDICGCAACGIGVPDCSDDPFLRNQPLLVNGRVNPLVRAAPHAYHSHLALSLRRWCTMRLPASAFAKQASSTGA